MQIYLDTSHGPREANITSRHVGDLGNIVTLANGTAIINIEDKIIQLYSSNQSIINLSIVVHYGMDDGGSTGIKDSATTGYDFKRSLLLLLLNCLF